jgi:hypothetical protein
MVLGMDMERDLVLLALVGTVVAETFQSITFDQKKF